MTSPSLRRLRKRLAALPERERAICTAYCLVFDYSAAAPEAYRRIALAGIQVLVDEMRRMEKTPLPAPAVCV